MQPLTTVAFSLSLTLAAQVANAQPSESPPSTPSDADSNDVSQINGHPVKVGEKHEYSYSYKRWNLAVNPFGPLAGWYSGSLSYAPHQNFAVRGELTFMEDIGSEFDIGVPIYFRKVYSGFFLEPGFMSRHDDDGEVVEAGPQVLAGWHHNWDSGLNISYAFGIGRDLSEDSEYDHYDSDEPDLFVNGFFKVGYNF